MMLQATPMHELLPLKFPAEVREDYWLPLLTHYELLYLQSSSYYQSSVGLEVVILDYYHHHHNDMSCHQVSYLLRDLLVDEAEYRAALSNGSSGTLTIQTDLPQEKTNLLPVMKQVSLVVEVEPLG